MNIAGVLFWSGLALLGYTFFGLGGVGAALLIAATNEVLTR